MNTAKRLIPLIGASIALMALFRILVPGFLNPENLVDLVQQISVNAIIAFGMTFCILIGGIDLSVGAVLAVVGTTAVYVLGYGEGETQSLFRFFLAVGAGLAVAVLFGAFNGVCAARTKMPPFIITLATMMVARGAALRFNQGRPISIPSHETLFLGLGNGRIAGVLPVPVLIMLVILVISAVLLHRTRFGQHLRHRRNRSRPVHRQCRGTRRNHSIHPLCPVHGYRGDYRHLPTLQRGTRLRRRLRAERHRRRRCRRHQLHRRYRLHPRHLHRRRHHRHPGQRPQPGRRPLLLPVHPRDSSSSPPST